MGKKTMQTTLNPSEISELIKKRVEELDISAETRNEGTVVSVSDGISRIHGLEDAMQGEMIEFPKNTFGLALNLERDSVGTVILGDYEHITEGDTVKCTGRILEVPQGRGLLGRVVDSLGNPIDGQGPIENDGFAPIEKVAPGVIWRKSVDQPVQTGLKSIDAMVPIGRGQRELIIGDRQIGKSAIAIDTILNQVGTGIKCIYVAIGQRIGQATQFRGAPRLAAGVTVVALARPAHRVPLAWEVRHPCPPPEVASYETDPRIVGNDITAGNEEGGRTAMENLLTKVRLYLVEIPATLVLAPVGFILEFMVTLPFIIACELDGIFRKKA